MRRYVLLQQSEGWRHKSLYHLRTLIDGQLVPVRGAPTLIHEQNSGTTCLRVYVPSQKMILSAWPIIPIILSVRSCYTLYIWDSQEFTILWKNLPPSLFPALPDMALRYRCRFGSTYMRKNSFHHEVPFNTHWSSSQKSVDSCYFICESQH